MTDERRRRERRTRPPQRPPPQRPRPTTPDDWPTMPRSTGSPRSCCRRSWPSSARAGSARSRSARAPGRSASAGRPGPGTDRSTVVARPTARRAPQPGHAGHGHSPLAVESHRGPASRDGSAGLMAIGPGRASAAPSRDPNRAVATSPAVGIFQPRPEMRPGTRVRAGDRLGFVDVLGVRPGRGQPRRRARRGDRGRIRRGRRVRPGARPARARERTGPGRGG